MLFRQVALVFGLEIQAVLYRIFKGARGFLQDGNRFSIRHALERALDDKPKPLLHGFIDKLAEQTQVLAAVLQRVLRHGLDEFLAQIHIALQIAEGHFRLDHPELRRVTGGVRILGAEGGAEGIDVGKRAGKGLSFELAAHG